MQAEKLINNRNYTQGSKDYEYLSDELWEEGYIVNGDIVTVDEWQFVIDRVVPKIIDDTLGKGNRNEEIQVEIAQPNAQTDFITATINIKITSAEEINSITINGEQIEMTSFTKETVDGKIVYTGTKEVQNNGLYSVIAKNIKDEYNNGTIKISSITEDMDIWNKADLKLFAKKVNEEGRTFEGKTVRVMANIDFNPKKYTVAEDGTVTFEPDAEQWVPIGTENVKFSGTFEGNYKTINGIYINTNLYKNAGLFYITSETTKIQNIILDNIYVYNSYSIANTSSFVGGFVVNNYGEIRNCGIEKGSITIYHTGTMNVGISSAAGGIAGVNNGKIYNSYNKATIISIRTATQNSFVMSGGIVRL